MSVRSAAAQWAWLPEAVVRYTTSGTQGRVWLLLHEMGGSLESWDPVLAQLPADQRIIRVDARGHGGSEKIRAEVTVSTLVDDVIALLDHLGITDEVNVAGVALGGCMALTMAARHPHRVHRVMAINPPTNAVGRSGEILRERADLANRVGMRGIVEAALARSYPPHLRGDEHIFLAYQARFVANDPGSYAFIVRMLAASDMAEILPTITVPTVFVSGRDDLVRPPADIAVIAETVPGAGHTVIEGGHIPSVQAPAALAAAVSDYFGSEDR
ncbi:alpha/beta fold hydrolase [Mycobacterium sp. AT1]|uniref:alpha/beta fold hydrolase n=1 Tax=Mycobacterium sp. AT1 TaxID=1961706 RepID=UPI0009AD54FE|nr:alpha/beta fold hydrolase [Mycobacterium sp. AT1]OPX05380.1 hypothetical protein B1790_32275 [Mycobacterium sp. AT1]